MYEETNVLNEKFTRPEAQQIRIGEILCPIGKRIGLKCISSGLSNPRQKFHQANRTYHIYTNHTGERVLKVLSYLKRVKSPFISSVVPSKRSTSA